MKDQTKTKKQQSEKLHKSIYEVEMTQVPLRTWFDNLADPIIIFDQETKRFLDCNQATVDRYGYTLDELRTMTPHQLHPPEEVEIVEKNIDDIHDNSSHRYTHIAKDGMIFHVEVLTNPIEYNGQSAWISVMRDITERAQAEAEVIKLNRELTALNDIGQALISTLDLREALTIITDHVTQLLNVEAASVVLYDKVQDDLWFAAASGKGSEFMQGLRLAVGQGIAGWVFQHGKAVIVPNVSEDTRWLDSFDKASGLTTHSIMCVPLRTKGKTIGAIEVMNKKDAIFDQENLQLLTSMAAPAATAIENTWLYDQAQEEIIEHREAKQAQRESEERLTTLLNALPTGIILIDAETHEIADANPVALGLIGANLEQVVGSSCHDYICPANAGCCPISDLGQTIDNSERVLLDVGGRRIPILKTVTTVVLDGRKHLLESFVDITDRKKAEDALQESETKHRSILASIEEGYFEVDLAGNLTFFNDALSHTLGYPSDELMGMNNQEYMDQETSKKVFETFNTVYKTGELDQVFEWEIIRKDEIKRLVESSVSLIQGITGETIGFRGVVRDITGHRHAQTEREQLLNALEHQSTQLQTAAEVSRAVGSILDPEALAPQVVDLVRERFGLYYAGLFLVDQTGEWTGEPYKWAVLRAGTGLAGQQMLRRGHKLEIGGSSMIGWCIANKQARITLDVGEDAVRFENPSLPNTRSELALPLISRGKPIGALTIQSDQEAAFSQDDIASLQTMADQMANAIANARLFNQAQREINERKQAELEAQRRAAQATLIYQVSKRVSAELELDALLSEIVTSVRDAFDYYSVILLLLDQETRRLTLQAIAGGYVDTFPEDLSLAVGEGMIGRAAATGEPQISGDVDRNPHYVRKINEETKSELSVPIKIGNKLIGVLDLQGDKFNAFDGADIMVIETMADQIAVAIRNAQLYDTMQQELIERQRTQEAMRQAEQRYHAVAESRVVGLGISDPDETLVFANPAFAEMLGYTQDELVGVNLSQLADASEFAGYQGQTQERRDQGTHSHYETALRRKDGSTLNILVSGSPFTGADGSFHGTIAVIIDITERKQAEKALQRALAELERYTDSLERQTAQLQVGAEVSREAAAILDVNRLLDTTVRLISERFGFYHAGVFLVDDPGEYAILRAASSEGGQRMLERGHRLSVGKVGIVGNVAATGEPRIALDVGEDAVYFDNPDMPNTRSEMGLPLNVRGRTIGVLDVQDTQEAAFTDNDITALQTLADQLAVAIDNARLAERTEDQLRELSLLYGKYSTSAWAELEADHSLNYVYDRIDVTQVEKLPASALDMALIQGETISHVESEMISEGGRDKTLATPIRLNDQIIGSLGIQETNGGHGWSPNEVALIEAVSDQVALALENAQHFAETQKSAQHRQILNELAQSLAARLDVATVLEETYWGASRLLNTRNFYIAFYDPVTRIVSFPLAVENDERVEWQSRQLGEGLTEHVIQNKQTLLIEEGVDRWLEEQGVAMIGMTALSWLGVPLVVGDQVLGVIAVQSETAHEYAERDQELLTSIASQTAIALQNARLFIETETALAQTEVLYRVGEIISQLGGLEETFQSLAHVLVGQLGYTSAWLALVDKQTQTLNGLAGTGVSEDMILTKVPLDARLRNPAVQVVLTRRPIVINDVANSDQAADMSPGARNSLGRLLETPIFVGTEAAGVIAVSRPANMPEISAQDVEVLQAIADQAAVALQNIRLLQETQRRAEQERRIHEITTKIRRSSNVAAILKTAVDELGQTLQTDRALVRLIVKPRQKQESAPDAIGLEQPAESGEQEKE
ncbi:MAG: GAF domain-containing protein [Chloroflexi bacterium]|nr:GAF domain-containing protein [Chloroflexota bacterium]